MKLAKILFLIYFLLKPYYLFSSGGIQIGDVFLISAFMIYLVISRFKLSVKKSLGEILNANKYLILFIAATFLINSIYFALYSEGKFLLSSLYFVFNLFAILLFSQFGTDKSFLNKIASVFKFNLIAQLAVSILGIGRQYGIDRYEGTFNDPNQFAFYILISYLLIYAIETINSKKYKDIPFLAIAAYLIFLSASTGNLLGIAVFLVLRILLSLKKNLQPTYSTLRKVAYFSALIILFLSIGFTISSTNIFKEIVKISDNAFSNQIIVNRISGKFSKADNNASINLWEDRGYDIIYKYPQYIPFGAGEGAYERYTLAANNYDNEVHATFPSMLFYYGILPFLILIKWFYDRIRHVRKEILITYLAIIIEGLTLLNQRQSLFWLIFALGGIYSIKTVNKKKSNRNE